MASKLTSETRRLYSWWWDSHISPKNSKWLQENLTDLDSKVKAMIKIINEDADSFARRAEMYYKKRPELMKLVEEFYRAYRALAERYDHATGELRLAHRTMIEAFPNQVPFILSDDPSPDGIFNPDELNKASDVEFSKKGFKQLNEIFKSGESVLRELKTTEGRLRGNLQGEELLDKDSSLKHSLDLRTLILNESAEMQRLKHALAKMEAEKDAVFAQYRQTLEKLSDREKELSSAQVDAKELEKSASEAQSEVKELKESLKRLEVESLDKILELEERLRRAEENADRLSEQNEEAEREIKALKEEVSRLNVEKEDVFLRYQLCLEMISKLQNELMEAREEAEKFKTAEDQQLLEKNTELEKLMNRLQDEESRFTQVEAMLHKLQDMQFQSHQEQKALALELRNGLCLLKDKEGMQDEILSLKEIKERLETEVRRQEEGNEVIQQQYQDLLQQLEDAGIDPKCIEFSIKNLQEENSTLLSQLQIITESMQKLLEKNVLLENSLQSANIELQGMKVKSRSLGDFCQFLKDERSSLQTERCNLAYRLEYVEKKLEKLETRFTKLEEKYILEDRIRCLQEENKCGKKEFEEQLEKAVSAQVEIFVLKKFMKDMEERNCNLSEAKKYSERVISELESENMMQHLETEYLLDKVEKLRRGIFQVLKALEIDHVGEIDPAIFLPGVQGKIKDIKTDLLERKDENQELVIQNDVLSAVIKELRSEKDAVDHEFSILNQQHIVETLSVREAYRDLENESREVRGKLVMKETENVELRELIQKLNACNEDLNKQCLIERERFHKKEAELIEAKKITKTIQVQCKALSECKEHQEKEIGLLQEANGSLENEVSVLCQEIEACKIREVILNSELHERSSEFELWEAEATSFYFDLQISSVREALLENKVQELSGLCEDLEAADTTKSMEIESLKDRITFLESESEELTNKLNAYVPSIKQSPEVAELRVPANTKEIEKAKCRKNSLPNVMIHDVERKDLNLQSRSRNRTRMKDRISFLESESEELVTKLNAYIPAIEQSPEVAELMVEKAKCRNNSLPNVMIHDVERKDLNLQSRSRNGTHMKDIPLDYISDASPSTHRRRKSSRLSDQLIGQWEASELDSSHSLTLSKTVRRKYSNPEIEKELGVDKLEVSKQGGNRKAILERLASDAQKLESLQSLVQELRRKMEMNKKSNVEYKRLKGQLHEVESSMVQLVSVNTELTKTVKGREVVEVEQATRRKMLEQSRRDSERIGSLQLEMQKIQSVLVRLEDEKNSIKKGGKSGLLRSQTGIILREFVYGRSRSRKKKKSRFCGCFRPSSPKEV